MVLEIGMFFLSLIIIALGGVSLILQKIYKVDTETGEQTTVDLPLLGKLSTNYPALAFVFIGAALAVFTYDKACSLTETWSVTGKLQPPPDVGQVNWDAGHIIVKIPFFNPGIEGSGDFSINAELPKTKTFEDLVHCIYYENQFDDGEKTTLVTATILPDQEYQKYRANNPASLLDLAYSNKRVYKPIVAESHWRQK